MSTATLEIPGLVAGTWTIDPSHSEVGFSVRHLMVSKVKGTFKTFEGTVVIGDSVLFVDPWNGHVLGIISAFPGWLNAVHQFHTHLLMPRRPRDVGGWITLVS